MLLTPVYKCQLVREGKPIQTPIEAPDQIARVLIKLYENADREMFSVVMMDSQNKLIGASIVSIGTLNESLVSPANVFKPAILANAAGIVVAHNHPSGNTTPSAEDIVVTERLCAAGKLLTIDVLDHIIIGYDGEYMSIRTLKPYVFYNSR